MMTDSSLSMLRPSAAGIGYVFSVPEDPSGFVYLTGSAAAPAGRVPRATKDPATSNAAARTNSRRDPLASHPAQGSSVPGRTVLDFDIPSPMITRRSLT